MAKGNAIFEIQFFTDTDALANTGTTSGSCDSKAAGDNDHSSTDRPCDVMFDCNRGPHHGGTMRYWHGFGDQWITYTFNDPAPKVARVEITWYGGIYVANLADGPYTFESSRDGLTWVNRKTLSNGDSCCPAPGNGPVTWVPVTWVIDNLDPEPDPYPQATGAGLAFGMMGNLMPTETVSDAPDPFGGGQRS